MTRSNKDPDVPYQAKWRNKMRAERIKVLRRFVIRISIAALLAYGCYWLIFVIKDPVEVVGYAYDANVDHSGEFSVFTLKYSYEYHDSTYYSSHRYVFQSNEYYPGDTLLIQVSASNPEEHTIVKALYYAPRPGEKEHPRHILDEY